MNRQVSRGSAGEYQADERAGWEYRFGVVISGKTVFKKKSTDEHGNKLMTKSAAVAAREAAIIALKQEKAEKPKPARHTVKEVFDEFCAEGRKDRAYMTIRKQDSLWENHLRDRFGNRYVDEISSAEVVDYLSELYYVEGKAFRYNVSLYLDDAKLAFQIIVTLFCHNPTSWGSDILMLTTVLPSELRRAVLT